MGESLGWAPGWRTPGQACPQAGQSASGRNLVWGACRGGAGTARTPGVLQRGLHVGPGSSRRGPDSPLALLWSLAPYSGAGVLALLRLRPPRTPPQPSTALCTPGPPPAAGLTRATPPWPGGGLLLELSQLPRALLLPWNQLCPPHDPQG